MERLKELTKLILSEADALGADMAQCTVAETEKKEFNVDGGEFSLMRTLFDRTVSITTYKDKKKGTIMLNSFDEAKVREAVIGCIVSSEGSESDDAWEICGITSKKDFVQGEPEADLEGLFSRTEELLSDIKERHPKIMIEQMITEHDNVKSVYANSYGAVYTKHAGVYNFELMYSAHEGEKGSSFFGSGYRTSDLSKRIIDCAIIDRELSDVEKQIDTKPVEGKFTGTALFMPGCLAGSIIAQAVMNFASDSAVLDGTGLWRDKVGEKVCDERISIKLAPHDERIVCGECYTGEGYISEDADLIGDGVLKNLMISRYVANKTGKAPMPNSSFALIVKPGEAPLEEIIKGIDRGIIIGRFSGGDPAPNGEFSGVAKNGFMIENGRITHALSETMISGNLADMLNTVTAISRETVEDGTMSVPYMAFGGVTISGK